MCKEKFNELTFVKREYELLRFFTSLGDNFSERANQSIGPIVDELIDNEEYLKYAICVNKDMFGVKQLNGVVTIFFMLANLESVKPQIADELITTLLFEYQDEEKSIPFGLTGEKLMGLNYLNYLLSNKDYELNELYAKRISELLIESVENKFDYWLLTLYFSRRDISIELKKFVIDSLDYDVLSMLLSVWEEDFMASMVSSLNLDFLDSSDDEEELQKELEEIHEEKVSSFADVINLINKKLYS